MNSSINMESISLVQENMQLRNENKELKNQLNNIARQVANLVDSCKPNSPDNNLKPSLDKMSPPKWLFKPEGQSAEEFIQRGIPKSPKRDNSEKPESADLKKETKHFQYYLTEIYLSMLRFVEKDIEKSSSNEIISRIKLDYTDLMDNFKDQYSEHSYFRDIFERISFLQKQILVLKNSSVTDKFREEIMDRYNRQRQTIMVELESKLILLGFEFDM